MTIVFTWLQPVDILAQKGSTTISLSFIKADTRNELKTFRHPAVDSYFTILAHYINYYNK